MSPSIASLTGAEDRRFKIDDPRSWSIDPPEDWDRIVPFGVTIDVSSSSFVVLADLLRFLDR
jgi:hypothetical protein